MKQRELIRHLQKNGCSLLRQGKKHMIFINSVNGKISSLPRHKEIKYFTAVKICRDLDIPIPEKFN
nr:type II toxin-antitoxin system HicA family toxin [Bacteroidota bacterium]